MERGPAFFVAVAASAVTMVTIFDRPIGFGSFTRESLPLVAMQLVIAFVLIAMVSFFPCVLATLVVDKVGARPLLPVCLAGALTTALVATFLGAWWASTPDGDPDQITFWQAVTRYSTFTLPAGLVGGLVFQFLERRRTTAP